MSAPSKEHFSTDTNVFHILREILSFFVSVLSIFGYSPVRSPRFLSVFQAIDQFPCKVEAHRDQSHTQDKNCIKIDSARILHNC